MDTDQSLIFRTSHLHKAFGPTIALKDVDFEVHRGEIRGLVGENGSGKSTIMSIAAGMQPATSGEMFYKDKPWSPKTMLEAQEAGIAMILQEANTIPGVTVAENLFAGREKEFSKFGIINMRKMYKAADEMLAKFNIKTFKSNIRIDALSFETRKLIEIIRAVEKSPDILVVDETTTALSYEEREVLYGIIRQFAAENKAVVFISHDLDEIMEYCTHLTVLRDGEIIGTLEKSEFDRKLISTMMVGREVSDNYYREDFVPSAQDEVMLEFKDVCYGPIKNFSLQVRKGEIVGIGGLSDCGMHTIGQIGFGLRKLVAGEVVRNGRKITSPAAAIKQRMGYISKNRDSEALILEAPIKENILLPSLTKLSRFTFISPKKENEIVNTEMKRYAIKAPSSRTYVSKLSGGNKQKVSFAKWSAADADVIIMDCPTRGVDIAVKQSMYGIIAKMKELGKAVLLISEELPELIGMSDRLIIMRNFEVSKEFMRSPDLKQTDIIEYMI